MAHTPGPWKKNDHYVEGPEYTVANCHYANGNGPEQDANTRLIAAAPDLLQAAQEARNTINAMMTHEFGRDEKIPDWMIGLEAKLHAAIAKAKGAR